MHGQCADSTAPRCHVIVHDCIMRHNAGSVKTVVTRGRCEVMSICSVCVPPSGPILSSRIGPDFSRESRHDVRGRNTNSEGTVDMAKNPTTEKFPRCPECGGEVRLLARKGRTREYLRGVRLPIPDDFGIPTCTKCGEESMNVEVSEPLDKLLGEHLRSKLRAQVDALRARHGS